MRRFWSGAGILLGKRVWVVLALLLVVTLAVAATGLPRLDFATGQDSYLNPDEQIAIDNEVYQDLFGGQAMVTLFTAEPGNDIRDLFAGENRRRLEEVEQTLRDQVRDDGSPRFEAVVGPLTAIRFTQALVTPADPETGEPRFDADGNPVYEAPGEVVTSAAGGILARAREREETERDDPAAAAVRLADVGVTLDRLEAGLEDGASFDNPEWVEFLLVDNRGQIRRALHPFFPFAPGVEPRLENANHAQLVVRMGGNLSIDDEGDDTEILLDILGDLELEGFEVVTTGAPVLLKDLNDYLQGGMATLGAIALLVMTIVLWFVFRVRWRLLSLVVVLLGILLSFGILGLVGIPLAIVTISGLPILIGIGVDFAIQVHNRVEEEVVLDKERHPMSETLVQLAPALVIATIAAVVAFLALQISEVPMIRDFGVLLAIGIVVLCAIGIILVTAVLGMREYRSPTTQAAPPSRIERFVPRLGSLPAWSAVPFAVLAVGVLVAGVLLEDRFQIQTDPEQWVNQDTQVVEDLQTLRAETGSSAELGFFLESLDDDPDDAAGLPVFRDEVGAVAWEFITDQLEIQGDGLLTASSLVTTVGFLMEIPDSNPLAPTGEDLAAAFAVAPDDIRRATVSEDGRFLNVIFRTGPSSLEDRKLLVEDMEEDLAVRLAADAPVRATPSGLAVVGIGLLDNLQANRAQLTYLALGLVALWLLLRFLSVPKMLLTMVPVLLAVGTSSLVVALVGIELSPMTTVTGPLVAAAVTEFSVLITTRYLEERRNGLASRDASRHATARTGRAFVASALTTIGGFGVLIFSALPLLRDFGIIVTINVTVALVVALVVLPPMLVFADDKRFLRTGAPEPVT